MDEIYLLKSCNEWKEHASAHIIGAARDRHTLLAMIGGEILLGNMDYGGLKKEKAYMKFCEDLHCGIEAENNLDYGYVEKIEVISENDKEALKERYNGLADIFQASIEDDEEFEM